MLFWIHVLSCLFQVIWLKYHFRYVIVIVLHHSAYSFTPCYVAVLQESMWKELHNCLSNSQQFLPGSKARPHLPTSFTISVAIWLSSHEWNLSSDKDHCCCDLMDYSLPGSSVHEIFQARIVEQVGISFFGDLPGIRIKSLSPALAGGFFTTEPPRQPTIPFICVCVCMLSHIQTVACQVPLSMGLSRQEYWTGLPFPPPGDIPNLGIEISSPMSPALQENFYCWTTREDCNKNPAGT